MNKVFTPDYPHVEVDEVVTETREVYPSHFLFKIKSFSKLSEYGIDKYETTTFVAGDYKWKLIIYPNGRGVGVGHDEYVSVYLVIADTSSLSGRWEVHAIFSIFLHDQKLDTFRCTRGITRRFHALNTEWGYSKFISKKLLTDPSNGYVVDDNCVFGAEVFATKRQATAECLSIFNVRDPYKHSVTVSNFSKLKDVWISENFVHGDQTWCLEVYPRGTGDGKDKCVSVFLKLVSSEQDKVKIKYTIRMKNQYTDKHWVRTVDSRGDHVWGWHSFIPIKEMDDFIHIFRDCCIVEVEILLQATSHNSLT